jgi:hypothetical protein
MWIQEALMDENMDGRCSAISCVHKIGAGDSEVYAIKIGETKAWDAKELASIFMHKAKSAVQDVPGSQSFYLYAFYAGRGEHQSRHHFRIDGGSELADGATEPPTAEGRRQQGMRMDECAFQFFTRQSMEVFRIVLDTTNKQAAHNKELMHENRELVSIFKEMLFERASSNHANKLAEVAAAQSASERDFLMKLAPPLLNSITGKEIMPQSFVDTNILESLIDSLDEEGIALLSKKVPPLVWATVASRAADHLKKKKAASDAAAKALEGRDPLSEAAE